MRILAGFVLCGVCASIGCRAEPQRATARPIAANANLLIITLDTVRADRLPPYGYTGIETPALSRLAREGVLFAAAYAPVPLTLPSHASMFTGQLPPAHGVRDNGGFQLGDDHPTLAEELKKAGYDTAAFVSAFVLDSRWGLSRGFDHYYDDFTVSASDLGAMARIQRPAAETWQQARTWLDGRGGRPFFTWLHLFDAHTPYAAPEPFGSAHADSPYDGEIAYLDSVIADVLRYLEARSLLEKTVVLVVADHGEGLGDHDEDEHGLLAYDSTLHVPWIMRLPGAAKSGRVVDGPVSLADMFPTVAGLLGVTVPAKLKGVDRAPSFDGVSAAAAAVVYSETQYPRLRMGWSELTAIRNHEYKYIRAPQPELYNYRVDPDETRNLAAMQPETVAMMERILTGLLAEQAGTVSRLPSLDPQAARQLQSLGYVAGGGRLPSSSQPLPDPKTRTATYRRLGEARRQLAESNEASGLEMLQQIVLEEPELGNARRTLRDYWIERRRFDTATRWFRSAVDRHPTAAGLWQDLAVVYRAAGQRADAVAAIQRALAVAPADLDALVTAGEIERDAGRLDAALALFKRAMVPSPDAVEPRMQAVQTLMAMRNHSEARLVLQSVLTADRNTAGAHYFLAQIAEAEGDLRTAEFEYRQEIAIAPWEYRARFNLALLANARGDRAEGLSLLQSIPPLAPGFGDVHFYIAKALLDLGDPARWQEAIASAERGLRQAPASPTAPLGHYVLADIYRLSGKPADAERQLQRGQALERRLANQPR